MRSEKKDREIESDHGGRGQGVDHPALEENLDIHQPVLDDCVGKRQRYQRERDGRELEGQTRSDADQVRNRVEEREGCDTETGSPNDPLRLFLDGNGSCFVVGIDEAGKGGEGHDRYVKRQQTIEYVIRLNEELISPRHFGEKEKLPQEDHKDQQKRGHVKKREDPSVLLYKRLSFRKTEREM